MPSVYLIFVSKVVAAFNETPGMMRADILFHERRGTEAREGRPQVIGKNEMGNVIDAKREKQSEGSR